MSFSRFPIAAASAAMLLISLCRSPAPAQQATSDSQASQQERAVAAMERSLATQQAALDAFRETTKSASLKQQMESVRHQTGELASLDEPKKPASPEPKTAPPQSPPTNSFFALPWPSSIPLSVPNIQMVDDTCQAMPEAEIEKLIQGAAKKQGIEPQLLKSVMRQESGFKPCAVSTAGAMGLMQIMPETADSLGLEDPFDPAKNTEAGAQFLKMMLDRYRGDLPMALGAYNAGPAAVDKAGGVPPISETMQYVANILRNLSLVY